MHALKQGIDLNHFMLVVLTEVILCERQVTQLGHVKDLATAFVKVLSHPNASREVFNISGER